MRCAVGGALATPAFELAVRVRVRVRARVRVRVRVRVSDAGLRALG